MSDTAKESSGGRVFSPVVGFAMVGVGALSLLFYLLFSAYAPDYSGEGDTRTNAVSRSAVGFAGLASFLRLQGIPVLLSRGLDEKEFEKASLVILTPGMDNTAAEIREVTDVEPTLIILPKWLASPDPLRAGWVRNVGLISEDRIGERLLGSDDGPATIGQVTGTNPVTLSMGSDGTAMRPAPIESLQTISGTAWTGYVTDEQGRAVLARMEGTETYVLSDPDLMNTYGLKDVATARVAAAIIEAIRIGDGPVIFDLTLAGYRRSPNPLRLAFEPPLLGATLCALLAALLMGLAFGQFIIAEPLENAMKLARNKLRDLSASGQVVLVAIDDRTLAEFGAAPWSGRPRS